MILKAHARRIHALRGSGKACPCCSDYGERKAGPKNRQRARQQQRQIEKRTWRTEI